MFINRLITSGGMFHIKVSLKRNIYSLGAKTERGDKGKEGEEDFG